MNRKTRQRFTGRRMAAGLTAAALLLAGLPAHAVTAFGDPEAEAAAPKGRYMETEIALPEGARWSIDDMRLLSEGTLRLACLNVEGVRRISLYDSGDGGESFEEASPLSGEGSDEWIFHLALNAQGGGAATGMYTAAEGEYLYHFLAFDPEGCLEAHPLEDTGIFNLSFSENGALVGHNHNQVMLLNPETGESLQTLVADDVVRTAVCGEEALILTDNTVLRYDLSSGEPLGEDEALRAALYAGGRNYDDRYDRGHEIVFADDGEGHLYYCTHDGLFRSTPGGSTVEQLVDGTLTSFSNPSLLPTAMEVAGEAILVAACDEEGAHLFRYEYDPEAVSRPTEEITIYSMRGPVS